MQTIVYILPELFLSIAIMFLLMLGVFIKKSFKLVSLLTILSLIFAIALILNQPNEIVKVFNESYIIDRLSIFMKVLTLLFCFFVLLSSKDYIKSNNIDKIEYPIIILASTLGMILMISSYDLIIFYLGLELQSLCLYILASFKRDDERSTEAGLKYFVLSALASGLLLYGCSLIYGFTGSTNFEIISENLSEGNTGAVFGMVFIIVGLAFKVSAVPFHMWTPDVYEGSPTIVTGFMSVSVKAAAFATFLRVFGIAFDNDALLRLNNGTLSNTSWLQILNILAILTVIIGNLTALNQRNVKRIFAYSAIAHAGYLMIGMVGYFLTKDSSSYSSLVLYFISYTFTGVGAFMALSVLEPKDSNKVMLEDLNGVAYKKPFVSALLALFIFSFAGIPPMSGFLSKFYLFKSAYIDAGLHLPVIIALIASVLSIYYYLRILVYLYMKKSYDDIQENNYKTTPGTVIGLITAAVFVLYIGIYPVQLITIIKYSFLSLIGG